MSCYAWELACLNAFVETDDETVLSRIATARSLIVSRILESVPISKDEWIQIETAVTVLESLEKRESP